MEVSCLILNPPCTFTLIYLENSSGDWLTKNFRISLISAYLNFTRGFFSQLGKRVHIGRGNVISCHRRTYCSKRDEKYHLNTRTEVDK